MHSLFPILAVHQIANVYMRFWNEVLKYHERLCSCGLIYFSSGKMKVGIYWCWIELFTYQPKVKSYWNSSFQARDVTTQISNLADDSPRFTAVEQYLHKLLKVKATNKSLATTNLSQLFSHKTSFCVFFQSAARKHNNNKTETNLQNS